MRLTPSSALFASPFLVGSGQSLPCGLNARLASPKTGTRLSFAHLKPHLPFAGGSVQKPMHPQNDSRVSRYKTRSCILSRLRVPARVTRYKSTCLLLRFHVYLATKCAVKFLLVRCLGLPPVFTCINPCKNIPVVGKAFLWKTAAPPPPQCALRWDATLSLVARWVFHHANAARRYCASSSRPSSPELWCRLRARRCCSPAALLLEIGIIEIPVDGTISAGAMIRSHLHRGEERRETARPSFPAVAPSGLCNHSRYRPRLRALVISVPAAVVCVLNPGELKIVFPVWPLF